MKIENVWDTNRKTGIFIHRVVSCFTAVLKLFYVATHFRKYLTLHDPLDQIYIFNKWQIQIFFVEMAIINNHSVNFDSLPGAGEVSPLFKVRFRRAFTNGMCVPKMCFRNPNSKIKIIDT